MTTMQQNDDGSWSPAIPEPLWVGMGLRKARCRCGRTFKKSRSERKSARQRYREHWASYHDVRARA